MIPSRRQATLFLDGYPLIDRLRREFNPVQASLIDSHVTLCRENEVADWEDLRKRAQQCSLGPFTLPFGKPEREGNLVLIRVLGEATPFHQWRSALLDTPTTRAQPFGAHITLIHPRNGTCSDEDFVRLSMQLEPMEVTFREIALIEQHGGGAWNVLEKIAMAS